MISLYEDRKENPNLQIVNPIQDKRLNLSDKWHYKKLKIQGFDESVKIKVEDRFSHLIQAPAIEEGLSRVAYKVFRDKHNAEQIAKHGSKKNAGKHLLRGSHNKMFSSLLFLYKEQLVRDVFKFREKSHFRCIDPTMELPSFEANNPYLASIDDIHVKTVYNHLERLEEAKILRKIFHGSTRNYELVFNPEIMIVIDRLNMDYAPNSQYLDSEKLRMSPFLNFKHDKSHDLQNTENQLSENPKLQSLPPLYLSSKKEEPFKSINENQDFVNNAKNQKELRNKAYADKEQTETVKSTQEHGHFSKDIQEQKREKVAQKREKESEFETLKRVAGETFFAQAFKVLYLDKDVYEAEYESTKIDVGETYFTDCKSRAEIDRRYDSFMWRVKKVRAWKDRGRGRYIQWPSVYFDLNNKNGFKNSKSWATQHVKNQKKTEKRQIQKQAELIKQKDNSKLLVQIEKLIKNYDRATYNDCKRYVTANIPHLLSAFEQTVMNLKINNQA